jgi:CHASE2 domain-containing sensor protein
MASGRQKSARGSAALATRLVTRLKHKGVRYWTTALIVFVLATLGSPTVYRALEVEQYRSKYFQWLLDHGPRAASPLFVGIILVDDRSYWGARFAGRAPIKRKYLAELIRAVPAHVQVIAVDFDMRLPDPHAMKVPEEYQAESCELIGAIRDVAARGARVVLAAPISFDAHRQYQRDSDIYQAYGLCSPRVPAPPPKACDVSLGPDIKSRISCGYIALPDDILEIPPTLRLADGTPLDSFSIALARAHRPERVAEVIDTARGAVRYGSFIAEERFVDAGLRLTADRLLDATPSDPKQADLTENATLSRDAVIIGGNWRAYAKDRGPWIDSHATPIGLMTGTTLHANFAEAILDSRAFPALPKWFLEAIEIALAALAAGVFALSRSVVAKLCWLAGMLAALLFFQWLLMHAVGVFFDAFLPLVGLALHSVYERLIGPHEGEQPSRRAGSTTSSAGT